MLSSDITCSSTGVANDDDDCDDNRNDVYPNAPTPPNPTPGVDYSCAGFVTCFQDLDQDGYGSDVVLASSDPTCNRPFMSPNSDDCNDNNAAIKPSATEIPVDDVDQNCDGEEICFQDLDLDLHGSVIQQPSTTITCNTAGVSKLNDDCNDNPNAGGASIYPGAPELPASGVDENCDLMENCYVDQDRDGYGRNSLFAATDLTCSNGQGYADNPDDCNDSPAGGFPINPGATEIPVNGIDEDCDLSDLCYIDADGDGYGRSSLTPSPYGTVCVGLGVAEQAGDCNDQPPGGVTIYPGAPEIPGNGIDENCDTKEVCYIDADQDRYGTSVTILSSSILCLTTGISSQTGDCNDVNPAINPGATEIPADQVDQDCDGKEDCYVDLDRDRYGSPNIQESATLTCLADGVADNDDDCYDLPPLGGAIHPGATEIVGNGIDDNCDNQEACYLDGDLDTYGRNVFALTNALDCTAPGYSTRNDDCNDAQSAIHPGAIEIPADGIDTNCDLKEDCYRDVDGDHYGQSTTTPVSDFTCNAIGVANNPDDCADYLPGGNFIYPGAPEVPGNGIDENCDGAEQCFIDNDGDDYGGTNVTTTPALDCNAPNATSVGGDCNDNNPLVYPTATEIPADGVDQNCDGGDTCYQDIDRDSYGSTQLVPSADLDCTDPGEAANNLDCLDSGSISTTVDGNLYTALSANVNPGADEICNFLDDDCDNAIDDADADVVASTFWYPDADGDNFGSTSGEFAACAPPDDSYGNQSGDCDDDNPNINPAATEVCDPLNVDENCNGRADDLDVNPTTGVTVAVGAVTVYPDADADGYGSSATGVSITTCDPPPNYLGDNTDCVDTNGNINPGRTEVPYNGIDDDCNPGTKDDDLDNDGYPHSTDCNDNPNTGANINPGASEGTVGNGIDDDCDGVVDDGTTWGDDDGDGYSERGGDCNDNNPNIHPGARETANNVDDDCDGVIDEGTIRSDDDGDGWTENAGDCNDNNAAIHPGITENCPSSAPICNDGIDNDCDGSVDGGTFDPDNDGYTAEGGDCDESDPNIHPGAPERPNGIDDDCDVPPLIDEGTTLFDDDGDGFTEQDGDCNDDDVLIHPNRTEQQNGYDDNCDGVIDENTAVTDDDGDGLSEVEGDCNDMDATIGPNQPEVTNGIDDDCDNEIDENADDLDEDGYTVAEGDCDDTNGWINPGRDEACDGLDNDCDGTIDRNEAGGDICTDAIDVPEKQPCGEGCSSLGDRGAPVLFTWMLAIAGLRRRRSA